MLQLASGLLRSCKRAEGMPLGRVLWLSLPYQRSRILPEERGLCCVEVIDRTRKLSISMSVVTRSRG